MELTLGTVQRALLAAEEATGIPCTLLWVHPEREAEAAPVAIELGLELVTSERCPARYFFVGRRPEGAELELYGDPDGPDDAEEPEPWRGT